ncbi:MAG: cation transporter [Cypionkella sp.]|nr:cation transporter [Cypionkella sp.]
MAQTRPRLALNLSAGATSALVAFALVSLKLWGLGQTGALSVAASLADSAMDLMVSLGALAALIYAARPADDDHAFGHSSAEDLAALGQALFVLISAGVIATAAVLRLTYPNPAPLQAQGAGLIVMLISVALTALWHWRRRRCWLALGALRIGRGPALCNTGSLLAV